MAFAMQITGIKELEKTVDEIKDRVSPQSLTVLSKNLAVLALLEEADYFRRQVDPTGRAWKYPSVVTLKRRHESRKGKPRGVFTFNILQDTGVLRLSVSAGEQEPPPPESKAAAPFAAGAAGAIRDAGPWGFAIGSRLAYAATHQYGRPGKVRVTFTMPGHYRRNRSGRGRHWVRPHEHSGILMPIPPRPFVGWSNRLIDRTTHYAARFLTGRQK